jgi:hypothetical protein
MAPKKVQRNRNYHEAGSSHQVALAVATPAAFNMSPPPAEPEPRDRIYITVRVAQMFWEDGAPMSWGDVHLPTAST